MLKLFRGLFKKKEKKGYVLSAKQIGIAVALKVLLSDFFCCYKCTTVPSIKKVDVFLMHLF